VGANLSLGCFYLSEVDVFVERRGREKKKRHRLKLKP
jgi:hypothetical protein